MSSPKSSARSLSLFLSLRMQRSNTLFIGYFARSKWCLLKARVSEAKRKIINNIIYVCVWARTCNRCCAVWWDKAYNNICLTELDKRDAVKSRRDTIPSHQISTFGISRFRMKLTLLSSIITIVQLEACAQFLFMILGSINWFAASNIFDTFRTECRS